MTYYAPGTRVSGATALTTLPSKSAISIKKNPTLYEYKPGMETAAHQRPRTPQGMGDASSDSSVSPVVAVGIILLSMGALVWIAQGEKSPSLVKNPIRGRRRRRNPVFGRCEKPRAASLRNLRKAQLKLCRKLRKR